MITALEALASAVVLALRDTDSRLNAYPANYAGSDPTFWTLKDQRTTYANALKLAGVEA